MKKTRIGRMIILVLAVVTVFAFSTTALASYHSSHTISASTSTSQIKMYNETKSYASWAAGPGCYFTRWNDSVTLTVRPYKAGTSTTASPAKTYSPKVEDGGQAYFAGSFTNVDVKANSSENGNLCGLTGVWWF